ncbi:MAG: family 10 glycosylhydrolase [Bacteroidales bacterium]|nr:family 10 glycosylhydrolase [Bacteroidales bacterium]
MKFLKYLATAVVMLATGISVFGANVPEREHRAIWMSPYLTGGWPTRAIEASVADGLRKTLDNRMAEFKDQNINVIYYHVRSNCDAMYKSSYEPWSAKAGGARGVEPAFDPLEVMVSTCHKYGIEVYAWVNPYRYNDNISYGSNPLEYENSHPDWLLKNNVQTVLNPGLEEVKQRICDVIAEIVTNYDVDGVVFDDFFYPKGGMPERPEQCGDYDLWMQQTGGKKDIGDWRRQHVNDMIKRVNQTIKSIKPYVSFCMAPAGVASPECVTSEYGLPMISGDWQYKQIFSDPLAWLKAGDIDIISPQIYWPERWNELDKWWTNAATKYNRLYFPSTELAKLGTTYMTKTFINEVETARDNARIGTCGQVYFQYYQYINVTEKVFDKRQTFAENMQQAVYPTKALAPLRMWIDAVTPPIPTNVRVSGTTLTWDEVPGMRYTVYAHDKAMNEPFGIDIADLHGITYTNSYDMGADATTHDWYVAVYDRYGNESSPIGVGGVPTTAKAPLLVYPQAEAEPDVLFDFTWSKQQPGRSVLELSDNSDFTNIVGSVSVGGADRVSSSALPALTAGATYWWRIRFTPVGAHDVITPAQQFVAPQLRVTSPAAQATEVSLTPVISWSKAVSGTQFTVELSTLATMANPVYTANTDKYSVTIPAKLLRTGRQYYVRVKAVNGDASCESPVQNFQTVNKTDYTAPEFAGGIAAGVLHIDQYPEVEAWDGMHQVDLQISASDKFPVRTSMTTTLNDFSTKCNTVAGEIKIGSKALTEGTTYYARTRGTYYVDNTAKNTAYSAVKQFVYSSESGVSDVTADGVAAIYVDTEGVVHAPADAEVAVYNAAGVLVATGRTDAAGLYTPTAKGACIVDVRVAATGQRVALKIVL